MLNAAHITRTASIRFLWPFLSYARAIGWDISHVGARLGLTEAELRDPDTRIPQQRLAELLAEAIERSGVRDLGLIAASYVDSSHFGISEFVARARPTLREALQSTIRFLPLLADGAYCSLSVEGKIARVRFWFDPSIAMPDAAYEFAIAIGMLRARRITGIPDLAPIELHFMHAEPEDTARHRSLFGCPVRFGAEVTGTVISAAALDRRMAAAEPVLDELLSREAERLLEQLPRATGAVEQVEVELAKYVDLRTVSAERMARKLGCSARTLYRRLQEEGTSYREVLGRVRAAMAIRHLEQGDRTIAEIAHVLGFSSPQSFHRSFKRATGTTAAQYRRLARGDKAARAAKKLRRR